MCVCVFFIHQNAEWRKMFGADDLDQGSLEASSKSRQNTEKPGDLTDIKKRAASPALSQSQTTQRATGSYAPLQQEQQQQQQQPLTMEPVASAATPISKPTKPGECLCLFSLSPLSSLPLCLLLASTATFCISVVGCVI